MKTILFNEYILYCIYNHINNTHSSNIFNNLLLNALNNVWKKHKTNNNIIITKNKKKLIY